jgi:hypothetical protein
MVVVFQYNLKKKKIAKEMTSADIPIAQNMSSRCLESSYIDC